MWGWEGTGHELLIPEFERLHPNIDIDFRISTFDQHHDGLRGAIDSGGAVPDVALVEISYLPEFKEISGAFEDLSSFGAQELSSEFLDWRWEQGVALDGAIVGLPTDVGGLAFAYRRDLFRQAGLPSDPVEVSRRISTWGQFIEFGEAFTARSNGVPFLDSTGSLYFARSGQGPFLYVDDDGAAISDPTSGFEASWDLAATGIDSELTAELLQFSPEWNDGMANDGFAMVVAPSWMRSYIAGKAPETAGNWGLATLPGVHGNWGGSQLTIPEGALYPEEAWQFIEFLTNETQQRTLFEKNGNFPSTPSLYAEEAVAELSDPFFGGQVVGSVYIESVLGAPAIPMAAAEVEINNLVASFLEAIEAGDLDADEALERAREGVRALVEDPSG